MDLNDKQLLFAIDIKNGYIDSLSVCNAQAYSAETAEMIRSEMSELHNLIREAKARGIM